MSAPLKIALAATSGDAITNYITALNALGAVPVQADAPCSASGFDGLLLPGGGDILPARYAQENAACFGTDEALDALQFSLAETFLSAGKPIFGVCRGLQLLNVLFGGTLIQHLPCADRHSSGAAKTDLLHKSTAEEGSFPAALYGTEFVVNSSHHQAADRIGAGLRVVQRSEDGVVEALCHETLPVWCVQWHPERLCFAFCRDDAVDGSLILDWFLRKCR